MANGTNENGNSTDAPGGQLVPPVTSGFLSPQEVARRLRERRRREAPQTPADKLRRLIRILRGDIEDELISDEAAAKKELADLEKLLTDMEAGRVPLPNVQQDAEAATGALKKLDLTEDEAVTMVERVLDGTSDEQIRREARQRFREGATLNEVLEESGLICTGGPLGVSATVIIQDEWNRFITFRGFVELANRSVDLLSQTADAAIENAKKAAKVFTPLGAVLRGPRAEQALDHDVQQATGKLRIPSLDQIVADPSTSLLPGVRQRPAVILEQIIRNIIELLQRGEITQQEANRLIREATTELFPSELPPVPGGFIVVPDFGAFATELESELMQLQSEERSKAKQEARIRELEDKEFEETITPAEQRELETLRGSVERADEEITRLKDELKQKTNAFFDVILTEADRKGLSDTLKQDIFEARERVRRNALRKGARAGSAEEEEAKIDRILEQIRALRPRSADPEVAEQIKELEEELEEAKRQRDNAEEGIKEANREIAEDLLRTAKIIGSVAQLPGSEISVVPAPRPSVEPSLQSRRALAGGELTKLEVEARQVDAAIAEQTDTLGPEALRRVTDESEVVKAANELIAAELTEFDQAFCQDPKDPQIVDIITTVERQFGEQRRRLDGLQQQLVAAPPEVPTAEVPTEDLVAVDVSVPPTVEAPAEEATLEFEPISAAAEEPVVVEEEEVTVEAEKVVEPPVVEEEEVVTEEERVAARAAAGLAAAAAPVPSPAAAPRPTPARPAP